MNALTGIDEIYDVLIVGAGISGIAMAVHLQRECPNKRFAMLERRPELGGTWDLFRYPGIRSDSDMYTMSLESEPWLERNALGAGRSIKRYLGNVVSGNGLADRIRYDSHVISADWHGERAQWDVVVESAAGNRRTLRSAFLYLASGYYDYDQPYDAEFPGREDFTGTILHPQFWPEDFDYTGKKVVVIGSGATAVTLVPAMAEQAGHVTMLQRSPTWIMTVPQRSPVIRALRAVLPSKLAHRAIRFLIVRMQRRMFRDAIAKPQETGRKILDGVKSALGDKFDPVHFTPSYNPWEQRLCVVPDGDLFKAITAGKASVVTDRIDRIDATGIALESGKHLDADVIVTATGLQLAMGGKIAVSVDGKPVNWNEHIFYKACMLSDMPNFAMVIVYSNASATLRSEIVARYVCRVLNHLDRTGAQVATPVPPAGVTATDESLLSLQSGYLLRSLHLMPRNGQARPWRLDHDYLLDRAELPTMPLEDGNLVFSKAPESAERQELEAAE